MTNRIILFDGVCHFCNWNVQFIIRRDPHALFSFASLQSDVGKDLVSRHRIPSHVDSIILIEDNNYYMESTAVLKIARHLYRLYPILYVAIVIPRPLRNQVYRFIAKRRYTWFGKMDECKLPSEEDKSRFLN